MDPMRIEVDSHDFYPKTSVDDNWIGDRYPLCVDLPRHHFLKIGATFRFRGGSGRPQSQYLPGKTFCVCPSNFRANNQTIITQSNFINLFLQHIGTKMKQLGGLFSLLNQAYTSNFVILMRRDLVGLGTPCHSTQIFLVMDENAE